MTRVQCLCTITEHDGITDEVMLRHVMHVCNNHDISCTHVDGLTFELRAPTIQRMKFAQEDFFRITKGHMAVGNVPLSPDTCLRKSFM